jgi:hypothetical protein
MHWIAFAFLFAAVMARTASLSTASNNLTVTLSPPMAPDALLVDSPFGINTAFNPNTPDLDARLAAMRQAGIKWGRQDFTWRRIERSKANTIGVAMMQWSKNVARTAC